jgi:hypothetical protein
MSTVSTFVTALSPAVLACADAGLASEWTTTTIINDVATIDAATRMPIMTPQTRDSLDVE